MTGDQVDVMRSERADRGIGVVIAVLALLATVAFAGYCGVVVVVHASQEVYGIPRWGVGLTLGLLALSVIGCGLVMWSRQATFSANVLGAAAFGVLGVLAMFSFGLFALLIAAGLLAWAARARSPARRGFPAAVGAVLIGAALPLLAVFALDGPLVECGADAISSGENFFIGLASGGASSEVSGSSTSGPDGSGSGRQRGDTYEYSYECRDQKLVRFKLRWR